MAFFNVDDHAHAHPKHRAAGLQAVGLWALAGSYCRAYKLDGQVPSWYVASWPNGRRSTSTLTKVGLWHAASHDCPDCPQPDDPDGWVFHHWLDIHDSSNDVERQRQQGRRRQRERRKKVREELGADL